MRQRTKEAENKYKKYKNKLTNIIRIARKEYYNKLLDNNKNNIKGIWNILNTVIKNSSKQLSYPRYFIINNTEKHDMNEVGKRFNKFFVSVGPDLAEQIPDLVTSEEQSDSLIDSSELNVPHSSG